LSEELLSTKRIMMTKKLHYEISNYPKRNILRDDLFLGMIVVLESNIKIPI